MDFRRRSLAAASACALVLPAWVTPAHAQTPPAPSRDEKLAKQLEAQQADLEEQASRIRDLEKKLAALATSPKEEVKDLAPPPPTPPPPPPDAPPAPTDVASRVKALLPGFLQDLTFSAYVQGQYESHQDAQDQLDPSGQPLNTNRFVLRRGRIKVDKQWQYASTMFELDGNTVNGPAFSLWHGEASILYRGDRAYSLPPILQLTMGLFDTPFGYELVESPRARWFMERSLGSRAMWPGEPDLGGRLTSAIGWFRASVALLNGNPAGEKTGFPLRDPAAAKDLTARAGFEVEPTPWMFVAGGASVYSGKGFHPGAAAGKTSIQWVDKNEDGIIEQNELVSVPATASTPSQTFDRWAIGADLRVMLRTPIGPTRVGFEVVAASNMDRGLFIADPILTGIDNRELTFMIGFTQEILGYGVVGFRYDSYDPNADATRGQAGLLLPTSETVRTYSPLVGLTLPGIAPPDRGSSPSPGSARLLFQYDANRNNLGRDSRGVPTNLASDVMTVRLQGAM